MPTTTSVASRRTDWFGMFAGRDAGGLRYVGETTYDTGDSRGAANGFERWPEPPTRPAGDQEVTELTDESCTNWAAPHARPTGCAPSVGTGTRCSTALVGSRR